MLNIYQRETEVERPEYIYSNDLLSEDPQKEDLTFELDGKTYELIKFEISDQDETTVFYRTEFDLPVCVSLRRSANGEETELCLSIPNENEETNMPDNEEVTAAFLESAFSAIELSHNSFQKKMIEQFGLQPGGGARALRIGYNSAMDRVRIKVQFANGEKENCTLSRKSPAFILDMSNRLVCYCGKKIKAWTKDGLLSAWESLKLCSIEQKNRLCADYGINLEKFMKACEKL